MTTLIAEDPQLRERIAQLEAEVAAANKAHDAAVIRLVERTYEIAAERDSLKEKNAELARCLFHVRCDHCGEYFGTPPGTCLLADHIEAHAALSEISKGAATK